LKVSRASFYRWRNPKGPSPRAVRHQRLVAEVTGLFEKEKGRAGRDQLTLMLNGKGVKVAGATVGAIMRGQGLRAVRTRAWKQTTVQDPQAKTAHIRNHMLDQDGKRDFTFHGARDPALRGHHISADRRGVALPGHRDRPVHGHGHRLGHGRSHARQAVYRRAGNGP